MKARLIILLEFTLILAGLVVYTLGYLPFPILPLILVAWASLHFRHLRWRDVGLRKPDRWKVTIGMSLLVGLTYQAADTLIIAPLIQRITGEAIDLSQFSRIQGSLPLLILFLVISWTEAAFIEELFFRGYLYNRLTDLFSRRRAGVIAALLVNALIFGMAHAYQGITGVIDTALAGLVMGLLYLSSGGNLWLPMLTHGIIDTVGFLFIYFGLVH